jgi:membrane protein
LDAKAVALLYRRPREVAGHLLRKFWRDECPQRAASLAYTTLLSLVPFLAVAFAILKGFGGYRQIQTKLEGLLYTHLVTSSSLQATEYVKKFTEGVHAGAIGAVGFLAFIVTSVSLLNTVASAFNRVWGVEERRSLKDRFLTFFTLTILGPVLFGASISITGTIQKSAIWIWVAIPGLGPALGLVVPFLLTWAGFLLLYEVIPSVPLRLRPALFGSLAVAVTWELVKIGFEVYVVRMASYGKVYGSLSVIPVFLLWLYVSWLIALLGFEVSFFLQHPEACRASGEATALYRPVPIPEAVRSFVTVAESFVKGEGPVTGSRVAERLLLPEGTAFALLVELERRGYLARVAGPVEAYLPCRTPAGVRVVDLWRALGGAMGSSHDDPLGRLLSDAADATTRALGGTTVQDLIDAASGSATARVSGPVPEDVAEPA